MSELAAGVFVGVPLPPTIPDAPGTTIQPSAGQLLRQAREAAGLHIAALAVSLKVPVKKLEALEADRFDLLPDAVFVRALAASVCRTLKVDAALVLKILPQTTNPKFVYMGAGINAPFRAPGDGPGPSIWTQVSRPAVLVGLALLLGALVLILLPVVRPGVADIRSGDAVTGPAGAAAKFDAQMPAPAFGTLNTAKPLAAVRDLFPPDADSSSLATAGLTGASPSLLVTAAAVRPADAASLTNATLAGQTAAPAASVPVAGTAADAAITTGVVVFRAQGESWVEVTDAKGVVVLRRILAAGEIAGASGALPLLAIVGRANVTQVQVRGKAFDLGAFSKDNVARFEVN